MRHKSNSVSAAGRGQHFNLCPASAGYGQGSSSGTRAPFCVILREKHADSFPIRLGNLFETE